MPSVLIVDDDIDIRHLLKQFLEGGGWTVYQAGDATEAMKFIQTRAKIHALVTDIRMPGASGVILLSALEKSGLTKGLVTVVISGQASDDEEAVLPILKPVAYLRKPFHPKDLLDVLNRHVKGEQASTAPVRGNAASASATKNKNNDKDASPAIEESTFKGADDLFRRISKILTVPAVLERLATAMESDETSARDIAEIAKHDPALTVRILKLVNSSFYSSSSDITDLTKAVVRLGFDSVRNLLMSAELFRFLRSNQGEGGLDKEELWLHSIGVAVLARRIALAGERRKDAEAIFTAALLHDIGKFLLDEYAHADYARVVDHVAQHRCGLQEAEHAVLGTDHCAIARTLMQQWKLPGTLIDVASSHHMTAPQMERAGLRDKQGAAIVAVANRYAPMLGVGKSGHDRLYDVGWDLLGLAGIRMAGLDGIASEFGNDLKNVLEYLDAKGLFSLYSTKSAKQAGKMLIVGFAPKKGICACATWATRRGREARFIEDIGDLPGTLSAWLPDTVVVYEEGTPPDELGTMLELFAITSCVKRTIIVGKDGGVKPTNPGAAGFVWSRQSVGTSDLSG